MGAEPTRHGGGVNGSLGAPGEQQPVGSQELLRRLDELSGEVRRVRLQGEENQQAKNNGIWENTE